MSIHAERSDAAATEGARNQPTGRVNGRVALLLGAAAVVGLILASRFSTPTESPEEIFERGAVALRENSELSVVRDAADQLHRVAGFEKHRMLLQGGLLLRGGNPAEALPYFEACEPTPAIEAPARLLTGECLYRLGRIGEARTCLAPLLDDREYAAGAHRILAAIAYDMGANNVALDHLHHLIQLAPDDFRPYHLMGRMYQDFSQFTPAAENYRNALERNPQAEVRQQIIEDLARSLMELRDFSACIELLESADSTATTLALHARCLLHLGELEQARERVARAERIDPENIDLRRAKALLLLDEGDDANALVILVQLVDDRPADHQIRYELALAYGRAGEGTEAERQMARAAELKTAYDRLSELNNSAIQHPDDADIRTELAEVCRELGKNDLAEVWDRAAAALREDVDDDHDSD